EQLGPLRGGWRRPSARRRQRRPEQSRVRQGATPPAVQRTGAGDRPVGSRNRTDHVERVVRWIAERADRHRGEAREVDQRGMPPPPPSPRTRGKGQGEGSWSFAQDASTRRPLSLTLSPSTGRGDELRRNNDGQTR